MNTVVPLISSGVAGPLGVLHLPRLWLKLSLESVSKLAPGYPGAGKGYDQMVIDGLGLNRGSRAACGSEGERAANSPVLDLHRPALYRDALSAMGVGILENALAPVARRSHRGRRRRLEPRSRMTWSWTLLGHIKSSWFCRNIFQKNQTP